MGQRRLGRRRARREANEASSTRDNDNRFARFAFQKDVKNAGTGVLWVVQACMAPAHARMRRVRKWTVMGFSFWCFDLCIRRSLEIPRLRAISIFLDDLRFRSGEALQVPRLELAIPNIGS